MLLTYWPGGTGQMLYLCIVGTEKDHPLNLATALIGERLQVRDAKILDNHVMLDIVEPGPDDPACCPGQLVTYGWTYNPGGALSRSRLTEVPGRLRLAMLEGREWVLRFWDIGDPSPTKPIVLLSYADGRFVGSGGCNRFFASVSEGPAAGEITIGPVGSTQMACPEAEMKVEARFLREFAGVTRFGFLQGRLALSYQNEEGVKSMQFDRR